MNYSFEELAIAFGLSLFAGLSTGIGGALVFFSSKTNTRFLSLALGFSAGVMIYISFIEIFPEARRALDLHYGAEAGGWVTIAAFFAGILFIGLIDKVIPSQKNPHEIRMVEEITGAEKMKQKKLLRIGLMTAFAVGIHNFPEGMATFTAALIDPSLGIAIAVAVAIHNIPEGVAVSVPVYFATGNKKKAFNAAFLSGLAEPVGAIIAWLILLPFLSEGLLGLVFAMIAGIMVFISMDELLPAAEEYGQHHLSVYGLVAGMAVMAVSLMLL